MAATTAAELIPETLAVPTKEIKQQAQSQGDKAVDIDVDGLKERV